MDNESTFDLGFFISTYTQSLREFFQQKIAELEAFSDYQSQQIEDLANKVMFLGFLAILLIIAIIVIIIVFKVSRKRRKKAELREAEERLRREEMRLREERMYYEAQRRNMEQGGYMPGYGYDNMGYRDDKYGRDEYIDEWNPKKSRREMRRRADSETTYVNRPFDDDDYDDYLS